VKRNAIAGRSFSRWEALEAHLEAWTREIADVRVHGTTGEVPIERFQRAEAKRSGGGNGHPRSPSSPQPRHHDQRRQLSLEGKAPQRASAEANRSRSKIGEKSVIAARSRASSSLASALFEGALARGLLRLTVHGDQNWRRWVHAD
jgi:hypothetical protein